MEILNYFLKFLDELGISYNFKPDFIENLKFLEEKYEKKYDYNKIKTTLIKIILDKYEIYHPQIKKITSKFLKEKGIHLSYMQKNLIEKYLCYKEIKYLEYVLLLEKKKNKKTNLKLMDLKIILSDYIYPQEEKIAIDKFLKYFRKQKKKDNILVPIFSRLIHEIYLKKIYFEDYIKLIDKPQYELLYPNFLESLNIDRKKKYSYSELLKLLIKSFRKSYLENKSYNLIVIEINQKLYDRYKCYKDFIHTIFKLIKFAYENLNNHRYLNIYINDIIDEKNINIRWKIYADIVLFSTKFKIFSDKKRYKYFYKPEQIYEEYISHLQNKYKYNSTAKIKDFEYINYGFKYVDTLILRNEKIRKHKQTKIISGLKNTYDVAIILEKKDFNFNPIPCPSCGSLQVSGNSFPEIGTRSWECKNPFCPERSKTNRGKRFSEKTYLTQDIEIYKYKDNFIEKDFINLWRKDIVDNVEFPDFIDMSIKYYSFVKDNILILGDKNYPSFNFKDFSRNIIIFDIMDSIQDIENIDVNEEINIYNNFLNKFLMKIDIPTDYLKKEIKKINSIIDNKFELYNGDSYIVLQSDIQNVKGMVTSPPYYNAREYSTWENIYLYLLDMFQIIRKSYDKLSEQGVFLFNIGDINDNENIVKSKMGEAKIPLGAYSIKLFERVGFSTLDCIIWSKGEPESNRHFNQGNYIPFFQKALNSFEYIFIFYKTNKEKLDITIDSVKNIKNNVHEFPPVIKISYNGDNKIGHSAPFPEEIPNLLIDGFLDKKEDSLLDPFAGIGTSVIAGLRKGKYVIGIELNKEYFKKMYNNIQNLINNEVKQF